MGRGPLVRVELEPGRWAKMHREDAVAAGLLKPKKKREPAEDKMRRAMNDKGDEGRSTKDEERASESASVAETAGIRDDFTEILGVGSSTAQELREQGFSTLEELWTGDLSVLSWRARRAIEEWRMMNGEQRRRTNDGRRRSK